MDIHSSKFSWHADTKTFVTEASDLQMGWPPDSFLITSARTGKKAPFVFVEAVKNASGDVEFWLFKPWNPTLMALGVTVQIFND